MSGSAPYSPERIAAVEVEPELLMLALDGIADAPKRRARDGVQVMATCAAAYVDYMGIEAEPGEDALEAADIQVIMAIASRLTALSGLIEAGHLDRSLATPGGPEALAEAACAARLIEKDGRPAFQLLDFLAQMARAKPESRSW